MPAHSVTQTLIREQTSASTKSYALARFSRGGSSPTEPRERAEAAEESENPPTVTVPTTTNPLTQRVGEEIEASPAGADSWNVHKWRPWP